VPEDRSTLASATGDGVIDDREEKLLLSKWLMEMGTTRSDMYIAYIVVHGYPAGDFTQNNNQPVESIRLMAILDRSTVTGSGDPQDQVTVRKVFTY